MVVLIVVLMVVDQEDSGKLPLKILWIQDWLDVQMVWTLVVMLELLTDTLGKQDLLTQFQLIIVICCLETAELILKVLYQAGLKTKLLEKQLIKENLVLSFHYVIMMLIHGILQLNKLLLLTMPPSIKNLVIGDLLELLEAVTLNPSLSISTMLEVTSNITLIVLGDAIHLLKSFSVRDVMMVIPKLQNLITN